MSNLTAYILGFFTVPLLSVGAYGVLLGLEAYEGISKEYRAQPAWDKDLWQAVQLWWASTTPSYFGQVIWNARRR